MSKNPLNAMVIGNVQAVKGYQVQADATIDITPPTANTLYTVLATTKNVMIRSVAVQLAWTVQPNPLEIIITADDQVLNFSIQNPATATTYVLAESVASLFEAESNQILATTLSATVTFHRFIEARSVLIQARTGATTAGTVSEMAARVKYSKIP